MNPLELAELLTAPTQHPVREALRELAPKEWLRNRERTPPVGEFGQHLSITEPRNVDEN